MSETRWIETPTLGDLLVRAATSWPDNDAFVFAEDRRNYRQLYDCAVHKARGLLALGMGPGDHVGIMMANCLDYIELMFGAALLGAVAVPMNSRYRGNELAYVVADSDLKVLVTSDIVAEHVDHVDRVREAFPTLGSATGQDQHHGDSPGLSLPQAPLLQAAVVLGAASPEGFIDTAAFDAGAKTIESEQVEVLRRQVALRSLALMPYTSGTTAKPKGCPMTHEQLVRNCIIAGRERFKFTSDDRFWDPLPMFHMSSILPWIGSVDAGAAFLTMTHFEPGSALAMMERERATMMFAVFPPITQALVNHPDYADSDLSTIRHVTNVAPPDTLRKLQEQFPQAIQITAYGCTEVGGVACYNDPTDTLEQRVTTSGRPFTGVQIRIAGPDGSEVPTGTRGEICVRGFSVFEGYWKDPEKTAETIDAEGWFHTGDIGTVDADGRVSYLGRLKDMLKVGGENVAAAEIESHLQDHPAVAIAQVVGLPDPHLVEVPAAFVELKPNATATSEELLAHCKGHIASFKVPRHIRLVSEWPMSATKIQKFRLRGELAEELGLTLQD